MTNQPVLHNIRVLDFTRVLAGPYATRILADFGAEVIKVQPVMASGVESRFDRAYYDTWNRNKQGITLDLDSPRGVALAKRLAAVSDVVVENFTPRVMANLGLDYDALKKTKPDIIMLSMSVMGQTGPWCNYTGFGPTVQAFSGMTQLTSFPGKPPAGLGFSYADHVAGLVAALALLGALEYRRRTGEGQHIDLSEVEAMSALLGDAIMEYTAGVKEVSSAGNSSSQAAPHNVYRCRGDDRWCAIAVFTDEEWQGFRSALGNPHWAENAKFATLSGRLQNAGELDRMISQWTEARTAEEAMTALQSHGVAAGVVQDASDIARNPQLRAREFFVELEHPGQGKTISDAVPIGLSQTPAGYRHSAPAQGQDNSDVYGKLLGISDEELAGLHKDGII